jgi:hypothetical protein
MELTVEKYELLNWLQDFFVDIHIIDGLVFLDRNNIGLEGIKLLIDKYNSISDAQYWNNTILVDGFLGSILYDDWRNDENFKSEILKLYTNNILKLCDNLNIKINLTLVDDVECGDFGFRITN